MTTRSLPMFPLGGVLFPGRLLPLQVFEPRYHELVRDCTAASEPEFGVVLIERGSEVGGGDRRHTVGCAARILRVQEFGPGRLAVIAGGLRRIRVVEWLGDDPYPLASVEPWPEAPPSDGATPDVIGALQRTRRTLALAAEVGDTVEPLDERVIAEAVQHDAGMASHLLAAAAPLGPVDQYRLLCCEGPADRLALLVELLDGIDEVLRFRLGGA